MITTIKWNVTRGNTNYSRELEERMLTEEAQEFKDGLHMYLNATTEEGILDAKVEMLDALLDFMFVFTGTQYKALGSVLDDTISRYKDQMTFMYNTCMQIGITQFQVNEGYGYVCEANEAKGSKKVNGKVVKGAEWIDPKLRLRSLLQGEV